MPRDLVLDFRVGGGSVPEIAQGIVRIWGTEVRPNGPSVVVTTETTLKLSEGKATLANAQTSGTGPLYEWAYIIQVEPFHGRSYRFYVAIPDGTGPVNLKDLPKLNPYTGEGFYVDIEEWEALYGTLPNRVDALETSLVGQLALKCVRLEEGQWVWDAVAGTHYVMPDHTGALVVRATAVPVPSATPELNW